MTTQGQSWPGSDGKDGYFVFPKNYWNLKIRLFRVMNRILVWVGVFLLCREAVGIFYSPSGMGWKTQSISTVCFEPLIQIRSVELRLHLELVICSENKSGSESEVSCIITTFSLCTDISILGIHPEDSLLIPKISQLKQCWPKQK